MIELAMKFAFGVGLLALAYGVSGVLCLMAFAYRLAFGKPIPFLHTDHEKADDYDYS